MEARISIRQAALADAGIIHRIIERSIRIGCALDHRNNAQQVSDWVEQHNADQLCRWLADSRIYLNIALLQDKPVGVGMATADGDIALCHVQPEWFRRGVGRALIDDLEAWLRIRGVADAHLNSTRTGEAFYRHLGYRETASPLLHRGLRTLPMSKPLPS
ncbi:GNAT family N-acetyltransferase [Pseudomonas sp. PB106]|uniref:GNAT family N-acetyltransferase n=1 Tax=Pseudomonas sp. PB106 TaxID=2494699 RepID=UPI00131CE45A|nr:GNAT family N-acetyltransferase [Pseudomonas sp. PB106]KAE9640243.1 GNAT family N-acetyltransferase [Pseudomonas sp. PB106]